jgi:hypothetical protein
MKKVCYLLNSKLSFLLMVPGAGIEPARLAAGDFESPASTNFTTRAGASEERNYGTVWGMKFHTLEVSIANKPPTGSNGC